MINKLLFAGELTTSWCAGVMVALEGSMVKVNDNAGRESQIW